MMTYNTVSDIQFNNNKLTFVTKLLDKSLKKRNEIAVVPSRELSSGDHHCQGLLHLVAIITIHEKK